MIIADLSLNVTFLPVFLLSFSTSPSLQSPLPSVLLFQCRAFFQKLQIFPRRPLSDGDFMSLEKVYCI